MRDPGTAAIVISSPSVRALLFLTGWNGVDILFREGVCFRRAPKLGRYAITSPQLGALDRSDEFAARWLFRLYLNQRLVADLGRCTLSECRCRKADRGNNQYNSHCHFPFAFSPRFFCAKQSERLGVEFDGLHAALEHAADQRP